MTLEQEEPPTTRASPLQDLSPIENDIVIRTVKLNKYFGDKQVLNDIDS